MKNYTTNEWPNAVREATQSSGPIAVYCLDPLYVLKQMEGDEALRNLRHTVEDKQVNVTGRYEGYAFALCLRAVDNETPYRREEATVETLPCQVVETLTKREQVALAALQSIIAFQNSTIATSEEVKSAFHYADLFLAYSQKK